MRKLFYASALLIVVWSLPCFAASVIPPAGSAERNALIDGIKIDDGSFMQLLEDKWVFTKKTSLLDNSKEISLMTEASIGNGVLMLHCFSGRYTVLFSFNKHLGNIPGDLEYKFDDLPIETATITLSDNGITFVLTEPVLFIKSMLNKNKLAVRLSPYKKGTMESLFDISGIDTAIEPFAKECGWNLKTN